MLEQTVVISNPSGLHARPAAILVQQAGRYTCSVKLRKGEKTVDAKSILGVLSLAVSQGQQITLIAEGEDEAEAIQGLLATIEGGLGEGNK